MTQPATGKSDAEIQREAKEWAQQQTALSDDDKAQIQRDVEQWAAERRAKTEAAEARKREERARLPEWERRELEREEALAAEREWAMQHRRSEAARLDGQRRLARGNFLGRVAVAAHDRGFLFVAPDVPGEGWASEEVRKLLVKTAAFARGQFEKLIEAEEGVAAAKRYLGGSVDVEISMGPTTAIGDLDLMRSRLDVAEARFAVAYEELEARRRSLADPIFLERLDKLNAVAHEAFFKHFADQDLPERDSIADAMRALCEACVNLRTRYEAALSKHSAAVLLAQQLGLHEQVPAMTTTLSGAAPKSVAQRAAAAAVRDWRASRKEGGLELAAWLPDWNDPYS